MRILILILIVFSFLFISCMKEQKEPKDVAKDTLKKTDTLVKKDSISKTDTLTKKDTINMASLLEGTWISTEDAKSSLKIKGNSWTDMYKGEKSFTNKFAVGDSCLADEKTKTNPKGRYITVFDGADNMCYYIISVNGKNLDLSYVGRGNTLSYKKKK
jgi:hypothetical protein